MFTKTFLTIVIALIPIIILSLKFITPVYYREAAPSANSLRNKRIIAAAIIFLAVLAVIIVTRNDVAIGGNERREWEYTGTIRYWCNRMLLHLELFKTNPVEISRMFWPYNDFYHPPFSRFIFALGYLFFHKFFPLFEAYRLGSGFLFALAASAMFLFMSRYYSVWGALFSVFSLCFIPHLFTHAHYLGTDVPIAVMWMLTAFSYYNAVTLPRKIIFSVILGLALLTKIQAFFIPIPLMLWSYYLHKTGRTGRSPVSWSLFFSVALITPLVVLIGWPWLWHNGIERFIGYLHWVVTVTKDGTSYFGTLYGANYGKTPWHYPFILLLVTVPLPIIAMFIIGISTVFKNRLKDETGVFLALNMLVFLIIVSFLGSWEGTREFLAAFIFLAAISGVGFVSLAESLIGKLQSLGMRLSGKCLKAIFAVVILTPAFISTLKVFPYGLFYYNSFIGGLRGASKAGFASYWDNELGKDLINFLNAKLEKNAYFVYSQGTNTSMKWYQEMGRIRKDIVLDSSGNIYQYLLNPGNTYYMTTSPNIQLTVNNIPQTFSLSYDGVTLIKIVKLGAVLDKVFVDKPEAQIILNRNIGKYVTLVGYSLDSAGLYPAGLIRITYFWRKEQNTDENLTCRFKLTSTSLEAETTPSLGNFLPLRYWPVGKIFREEFELKIPNHVSPAEYKALLICNTDAGDYKRDETIVLGDIVIRDNSLCKSRRK